MNLINDSGNSGSTSNEPIHYENILTKFSYNSEGEVIGGKSYPYFNICINLAEITKDKVTILTDASELADEIDVERARRAKERAEKRLASKDADIDYLRAEIALKKAIARIELAEK